MDAVASIREANGPKGVAQERHLIQPSGTTLDSGLRRSDEIEFSKKSTAH